MSDLKFDSVGQLRDWLMPVIGDSSDNYYVFPVPRSSDELLMIDDAGSAWVVRAQRALVVGTA